MPSAASFFAVRDPTPHRARVGRSPMTSDQFSAVSTKLPRGLPNSVAIFARSLLSPIPTEQCSPVAVSTRSLTTAAKAAGSGRTPPRAPFPSGITGGRPPCPASTTGVSPCVSSPAPGCGAAARNASSQPSTSTTTGRPSHSRARSVAITSAEAASYAGRSTGRNTASGQRRAAMRNGIPEATPKARAS
jgi:hypothetical protein